MSALASSSLMYVVCVCMCACVPVCVCVCVCCMYIIIPHAKVYRVNSKQRNRYIAANTENSHGACVAITNRFN